jgi:hypothetical protein
VINELLARLRAARTAGGAFSSNEDLCSGLTTVNSRSVRADGIHSNRLIATDDVLEGKQIALKDGFIASFTDGAPR